MKAAFQQIFGQNTRILNNIESALSPIEAKGPSQFGMSPAQEAAERSIVAQEIAKGAGQLQTVEQQIAAAKAGGAPGLPMSTAASAELGAEIGEKATQAESEAQLGITQRGYDIGRQNFWEATNELSSAPGRLEAPVVSAGGTAMAGAEGLMQGATDITQANQAWMQPVAALAGGIAKAAAGAGAAASPATNTPNPNPADAYAPGFSQSPTDSYT